VITAAVPAHPASVTDRARTAAVITGRYEPGLVKLVARVPNGTRPHRSWDRRGFDEAMTVSLDETCEELIRSDSRRRTRVCVGRRRLAARSASAGGARLPLAPWHTFQPTLAAGDWAVVSLQEGHRAPPRRRRAHSVPLRAVNHGQQRRDPALLGATPEGKRPGQKVSSLASAVTSQAESASSILVTRSM
jgi:hypothetical protein